MLLPFAEADDFYAGYKIQYFKCNTKSYKRVMLGSIGHCDTL